MFGKDQEARDAIQRLESQVAKVGGLENQVKHLVDDVETLTRRVRALTTGDTIGVFSREVIDKIDREQLVKEVVETLRAEVAERAKEDTLAAIRDRDFSDVVDQDRVEELVVEAVVSKLKDILPLKELVAKVAEELVQGDHLDISEIEQGVVNDVTERMEVTVKLTGQEEEE